MTSIIQIFKERKECLPEFIEILEHPTAVNIILDDINLSIDYRKIVIPSLKKYSIPIVMSCGWGSGWEGIVPLAFSLACEGFEIFIISLPGYGDSDNLPSEIINEDVLKEMAKAVIEVMKKLAISSGYLIGHSMAAIYLAKVAKMKPHMVKKLVLLNAAGIKRYNNIFSKLAMTKRFIFSGIKLHLRYKWLGLLSKEDDFMLELVAWCGKQKSPFEKGRRKQRFFEFRDICKGDLVRDAKEIEIPVVYISGDKDTVFDPYEGKKLLSQAFPSNRVLDSDIIAGVPHNSTLYHTEIVAAMIGRFLE